MSEQAANQYGIPTRAFFDKNLTNLKQTHKEWMALVTSPGSQAVHRAHRNPPSWPALSPRMEKERRRLKNRDRRIRQGRLDS